MVGCGERCAPEPSNPAFSSPAAQPEALTAAAPGPLALRADANSTLTCSEAIEAAAPGFTCRNVQQA